MGRAPVIVLLAVAASCILVSFWSPDARAADQTVLGKSFAVKDPQPGGDPSLRSIVTLGQEVSTDDTLVGDPLSSGATVEIVANGAIPSHQVFALPPGASVNGSAGWR